MTNDDAGKIGVSVGMMAALGIVSRDRVDVLHAIDRHDDVMKAIAAMVWRYANEAPADERACFAQFEELLDRICAICSPRMPVEGAQS